MHGAGNTDTSPLALASRLLKAESTTGKCYVITFSPSHNITLADMPAQDIMPVIDTWTKIYTAHLDPRSPLAQCASPMSNGTTIEAPRDQYRYMQIFENKGAAMGCSNPHPHGQIWTTTSLPEEPSLELQHMQQYRQEENGSHLLVDYAKLECEKGERTVYENRSFWAGCPWWATWPFEVMVISKSHKRALVDFDQSEKEDLADVLSEVTRRYDNLFETNFPYSTYFSSLVFIIFFQFSKSLPPFHRVLTISFTFTYNRHGPPPSPSHRHPGRNRSLTFPHSLLSTSPPKCDREKISRRI